MAERSVTPVYRGASHRLLIAALPGEDVSDLDVIADVRRLPGGRNSYTPDSATAVSYAVTAFEGNDDQGPGWWLDLAPAATAELDVGTYAADARISVISTGEIHQSPSWVLEVVEPVTLWP